MAISRRLIAAVALAVAMLTLVGCASSSPAPVSAKDRARIRSEILEGQWAPIAATYPEAVRPKTTVTHTVPDFEWATDVVGCLNRLGNRAKATGGSVVYSSTAGETSIDYAVVGYLCTSSWVKLSDVQGRLTGRQEGDFENFEIHQVRPCLLLAGVRSPPPPTDIQASGLFDLAGWSPFDLVRTTVSTAHLDYLEQRCPPIPAWIDLASRE
jgi:hypothetical protein